MPYTLFKKLTIFLFVISIFFGLTNNVAFALNTGLNDAAVGGYGKTFVDSQKTVKITGMAGRALGMVLSFVGVIFFALMIYGGITWMTAAGSEEKIKKAQNIITAAIVGVIIVASAYGITTFIGKFIGS